MKVPVGLDLNGIEIFLLTAELGGMTQSARHLGLTQSAVSQTISRLEQALDARLFDRAMRPLALTHAGRLLVKEGTVLLATVHGLRQEVRNGSAKPADCVVIAMAESIANHLTAPLLKSIGSRALRWQLRSGISLLQHHEFVARKLDMLITGSSQLEDVADIAHFPIMEEGFVLIAPASHVGPVEPIEELSALPFVRYSMLSAMGQRIERQIARLQLQLPKTIEVDSTLQQISTVAAGVGWSITTPLCLASHLELLSELKVEPMRRGGFCRQIQLISRRGEFGDLPRDIARLSVSILRDGCIARLQERLPWLSGVISWREDQQ